MPFISTATPKAPVAQLRIVRVGSGLESDPTCGTGSTTYLHSNSPMTGGREASSSPRRTSQSFVSRA